MKHSLLLAFALIAPATLSAAAFEGRVNFKMTTARGPQEIAYNIKGDKIRVEMPGQNAMGGMILDTTKKETTVIMDQQKMYMTMAIPDGASAQNQGKKASDAQLEKTGEKDTILGYTAEKFVSSSQGTKTELWLAEGLGTFMMANGNPMGGRRGGGDAAPQGWEKALAGKELFPLRVVSKDASGKETFRMEATAIDKKPLADSLFVPPAGYQKFDMGGMMQGMMKGGLPGMPGK